MSQQDRSFPAQHQQQQPGVETESRPQPHTGRHRGCGKLERKVALITGGDSGIGRAVAVAYAREGADAAIAYLNEHEDAQAMCRQVGQEGRRSLAVAGDVADESFCRQAVIKTVDALGHLDIRVNNAAEQHPRGSLADISAARLERTFKVSASTRP